MKFMRCKSEDFKAMIQIQKISHNNTVNLWLEVQGDDKPYDCLTGSMKLVGCKL